MFPPLYPTYEIKVKCKTEYSTCHAKIKRTVSLFSAQDTQSQPEAGLWQAAYAPICSRQSYITQDHSGWRALMRVLQTHLPTFWGQSSVEHHSCQRLLLHAHNNLFASHMPITGDAAAVFIYQCHKINYLLAALFDVVRVNDFLIRLRYWYPCSFAYHCEYFRERLQIHSCNPIHAMLQATTCMFPEGALLLSNSSLIQVNYSFSKFKRTFCRSKTKRCSSTLPMTHIQESISWKYTNCPNKG